MEAPQEIHANYLLKREREIDWVTELLSESVRNIIAKSDLMKAQGKAPLPYEERMAGRIPLDDVADIVRFPELNIKLSDVEERAKCLRIPEKIAALLRQYVSIVSRCADYHRCNNLRMFT